MDGVIHNSIRSIANDMALILKEREAYHILQDKRMETLRTDIDALLDRTNQLKLKEGDE